LADQFITLFEGGFIPSAREGLLEEDACAAATLTYPQTRLSLVETAAQVVKQIIGILYPAR